MAAAGADIAAMFAQAKLGMTSGEGFYKWDAESAARGRARYKRTLLRALEILKTEA